MATDTYDELIWKQGDSGNTRTITLTGQDGEPAVLVGASVAWRMTRYDGTVVVDAPATVLDAANGTIVRDRDPLVDTAEPGRFRLEFAVNYGGGDHQTFPEDSYLDVLVLPALA